MTPVNALGEARVQLGELLAAAVAGSGAVVVDNVPEELPTPCVVLDAGDDYLSRTADYSDDWWLTLRVYALVDLTSNAQGVEDLEALLVAVLPALSGSEWEVDPIGKPGPLRTAQWLAHGVPITVRTTVTLNPAHDTGEAP